MYLKNEMEGYMGRFRGRKGKAEIISKIKKKNLNFYGILLPCKVNVYFIQCFTKSLLTILGNQVADVNTAYGI